MFKTTSPLQLLRWWIRKPNRRLTRHHGQCAASCPPAPWPSRRCSRTPSRRRCRTTPVCRRRWRRVGRVTGTCMCRRSLPQHLFTHLAMEMTSSDGVLGVCGCYIYACFQILVGKLEVFLTCKWNFLTLNQLWLKFVKKFKQLVSLNI